MTPAKWHQSSTFFDMGLASQVCSSPGICAFAQHGLDWATGTIWGWVTSCFGLREYHVLTHPHRPKSNDIRNICVSLCVYVCLYKNVHIYIYKYIYIYTYIHTYIHTYIRLHYITFHSITLHHITLHYTTLHYTTLHYITLRYITYIHTYI